MNNYAFIDSQNVYLSVKSQGWEIDWKRFRVYLKEKYDIEKAFLFIGYVSANIKLYKELDKAGFICIFKSVIISRDGTIKGNVDAELVLTAMIEINNYDKAILVTGDGDFHCLAEHLRTKRKLTVVLIPNKFKYSALFKIKILRPYIRFMNDLRNKIKKAP